MMRLVNNSTATKQEVDWRVTFDSLDEYYDKGWYKTAVRSGEYAKPFTSDPLLMLPIIDACKIATMPKRKGDVWIWSACLVDEDNKYHWAEGESLIEAAARVYLRYLHGDTFEVPEVLKL